MVIAWLTLIIALFLYSFTQIDLGLTLTRASWWQVIQRWFQQIGYFQRPLSTGLYLGILVGLFVFYLLILKKIREGKLKEKQVWLMILGTALILWLSYNAFSYDLFNYIMDAKMVTFYQQSPYTHRALDFPGDPMLGFMHWTHRYYPYGPTWLLVTVPLSFLGLQKLLPTMILIKGLGVIGYLLSCLGISRFLEKINPQKKLLGLAAFAFSPLVIIEGLVSAHNDILMMGLGLMALWLLLEKKYLFSWLTLILSAGVKFVTAALVPIFVGVTFLQKQKKNIPWEKVMMASFGLMVVAVIAAIVRDELKPWYLLYLLAFLPFLAEKKIIFWSLTGFSLGSLLHYAPFLYQGNWNPPVPTIKLWVTIGFLALGTLIGTARSFKK